LRNDYGVALMEMGRKSPATDSDNTLLYFAKALEEFAAALKLDSKNVESLHNRALLLEKMKLPEQCDQAWQAFLAQETEPHWTAEAKHHVQILSQTQSKLLSRREVIESFLKASSAQDDEAGWRALTRNKEMITQRYIPQELTNSFLIAKGNKNADEAKVFLDALRYAGKLELEKASDPFVSEFAEYYAHTSVEQQNLLRDAHALLRNGYASCLNDTNDSTPFAEAGKLFKRAGDVWEAKICDYWIAYSLTQTDIDTSTALLTSLVKFSSERHYHWLQAQAICWLANEYTEQGRYSQSIESYKDALAIATRINDSYNQQKILSQLGNSYMHLGQPGLALQYDWQALEQIEPASDSVRQAWRIYLYTTRVLMSLNLFEAASEYGAAMLNLASNEMVESPGTVHFSYLYESQINGGKQNYDEAFRLAKESLKFADSITSPANALKLRTGSLLLLAHLQRQSGAIQQALENYNQVIDNQSRMEGTINNYNALKGRLLCYAALKDDR